jgi:hypothetical protein
LGYEPLKSISKNLDFLFCSSFQNLRLGSMKLTHPKRHVASRLYAPQTKMLENGTAGLARRFDVFARV